MDKLLTETYKRWQAAKEAAQRDCEAHGDYALAEKLRECRMFKGTETLEQLVKLMFTSRGVEFMTVNGFPTLKLLRRYKQLHPERLGVYIDCGKVELTDQPRVFLIGDTHATLHYKATQANRLYLMHGAQATVSAKGYSVVNIEKDKTSSVTIFQQDNAFVR